MSFQSLNTEFDSAYELYTDKLHKPLEVVVCLRCGRPLTNEKSRQAQLGPKCARKLAYETRTRSFSPKTLQHYQSILNTSHTSSIPTQAISLHYIPHSSHKPYCKIGAVSLVATNTCTTNNYQCQKKVFSLPLFEGTTYEICVCLPQVRVFLLQVQNHHLIDISKLIQ